MGLNKEPAIHAMIVLDVIGRPPEHLIDSLEEVIKAIDAEKGVSVKNKDIKKPELMKDSKDFYTTFAEVEIEVEEMMHLIIVLFKYMPAHIEIMTPEIIAITNNSWNDILNELARRLHGYDEIARIMQMEKTMLENKISELTGGILQPESNPLAKEKSKKRKSTKKNTKK